MKRRGRFAELNLSGAKFQVREVSAILKLLPGISISMKGHDAMAAEGLEFHNGSRCAMRIKKTVDLHFRTIDL